jgi:ATP-dependent RNA helicase DDX5/DBP2
VAVSVPLLPAQGEREAALRDFSSQAVKVLVATDVASRGLDIKGIGHVVNMDLPKTFEDYVHRIGRTGRAGERQLWEGLGSTLLERDYQATV